MMHTYNLDNKLDYIFNEGIIIYEDLGFIENLFIHHQLLTLIGICYADVHVGYDFAFAIDTGNKSMSFKNV